MIVVTKQALSSTFPGIRKQKTPCGGEGKRSSTDKRRQKNRGFAKKDGKKREGFEVRTEVGDKREVGTINPRKPSR